MIWVYILAAIVSWLLWNVIHEMSHVVAAKAFGKVKSWTIKPYPHMHNGSFRFAGAYWDWEGDPPATAARGMISLAPRIMNFLAIELIIITFFLSGMAKLLLLIFCLGGVVDMFVGSIGYGKRSDLRRGAERLEISPWKIRTAGLAASVVGVLAAIASFL